LSLIDTIKELLPELSKAGSTEAVFGDPIETGGVVVIPVARLVVGFLGLGSGGPAGLGGAAQVEPVALIVIKDRQVKLVHFGPPGGTRRRSRHSFVTEAGPGAGLRPDPAGLRPAPGDDYPFSLDAIVNAIRTLVGEVGRGAGLAAGGPSRRRTTRGNTARHGNDRNAPDGRLLGVPEEGEEQKSPQDVADRGHGEGQTEA
jgi:hypothetical protein